MISRRTAGLTAGFVLFGLWTAQQGLVAGQLEQKVTFSRGVLEWPTYEFTGREMQPPLFW